APGGNAAGERKVPIDAATLKLSNATAEAVSYKGKAAIRVTDTAGDSAPDGKQLALIPGIEFGDGDIYIELAGDTKPGSPPTFRGFTGLAFRVAGDGSKYEAFYLRPKNGRSDNQEQRNHSAQYISFPDYGWKRLRDETPSRYESYVDLVPGEWNAIKIEVRGDKARLYVNGATQPALLVNDLKHGAAKGGLSLWVGPGTIAHFANLRIKTAE
ncbi:MAG: family 16 glycoside hydrolase, partial [Bryobacteraceae bacterium]